MTVYLRVFDNSVNVEAMQFSKEMLVVWQRWICRHVIAPDLKRRTLCIMIKRHLSQRLTLKFSEIRLVPETMFNF